MVKTKTHKIYKKQKKYPRTGGSRKKGFDTPIGQDITGKNDSPKNKNRRFRLPELNFFTPGVNNIEFQPPLILNENDFIKPNENTPRIPNKTRIKRIQSADDEIDTTNINLLEEFNEPSSSSTSKSPPKSTPKSPSKNTNKKRGRSPTNKTKKTESPNKKHKKEDIVDTMTGKDEVDTITDKFSKMKITK